MSVAIKNIHGQYWTGKCWGVREAAAQYNADDSLPEIEGLELWEGWGGEAYYYPAETGETWADPFAAIEGVRGA